MKRSAFLKSRVGARSWNMTIALVVVAIATLTFFSDHPLAFLMLTLATTLPGILWLRAGAPGIPILPILSVVYFVYYAVPIARNNIPVSVDEGGVMRAATAVALFMIATSLPGLVLLPILRRKHRPGRKLGARPELSRLINFGLAVNIVFFVALFAGWLETLGSVNSMVRAAATAAGAVSCYLLGYCIAAGMLRGTRAWIAGINFSVVIIFQISTLFLVGAMLLFLAALFGYIITAKRVPWTTVIAAFVVISILHAGKGEMRQKYWLAEKNYGARNVIVEIPSILSQWVEFGITNIIDPKNSVQTVVDRASLLEMLMYVQNISNRIPYLEGATYALLPQMLMPRFLDPDKITSQAAMILLNVHFERQTFEGTAVTAIGWGIIAEAFGNFGNWGIFLAGLVYGALCWLFTFWSAGTSPLSLRNLIAIAVMATFMNIEFDFSYLLVTLWQAIVAAASFYFASKFIIGRGQSLQPNSALPVVRGMYRGKSQPGATS